MLLLSTVSEYFCVMRQSAMAGVGFLPSAAFLSDHFLCRGEIVKLKIRAFFGTLWGTFLAVNLYCSSSLCLQNWSCLSLEVPEKAEKYSQLHCNFWETRGLDCRCIDWICHILQLRILLLFRCHRSFRKKAHLSILFITDMRWIFVHGSNLKILITNPDSSMHCSEVLYNTLKIFIVCCVFLMNSSLGFNKLNLLPFTFLKQYLIILTVSFSLRCCSVYRASQLRLLIQCSLYPVCM